MIYIIVNTLAFAGIAAAVWIAGYVLAGWIRPEQLPADLRQLARFCLGLAFWILVAFVLAALGRLETPVLVLIGLAVGLAALVRRRRTVPFVAKRRPGSLLQLLTVAGLALVAWPVYLLTMAPEISWDAGTYHLTLPRLFAAHHGFRPVALNVYSNWPLNTELLFTLAMVLGDHILAKLVHFGFGLLTVYAIHVACRGSGHPWTGALASALFLANHVVIFEMTAAYVDLAHAFFLLAAFVFMIRARGTGVPDTRCLFLAGLSAGLMAGVKISGIVGASILATLLLPSLRKAARSRVLAAWLRRVGAAYALPVVLLVLPWLFKAWWYTGNPVYPFAYSVFGGPDWSVALTEQLRSWLHGIGMGRTPLDYLRLPARIFLSGGDGYDRFSGVIGAFWIGALPLALFYLRAQAIVRSSLLVAGLSFVFWSASSQQMRLFIPALPFLAIASAVAISATITRLGPPRARTPVHAAVLVAALTLVPWSAPAEFRAGLAAVERFRSARGDLLEAAVPPVFGQIDHLAPDARLLFVNTNHGFHCRREFIADSFFEASQIADWLAPAASVPDVRRRLAERGITHLLVLDRNWGIAYPQAFLYFLRDPGEVRPRFQSPDRQYTLLELVNP